MISGWWLIRFNNAFNFPEPEPPIWGQFGLWFVLVSLRGFIGQQKEHIGSSKKWYYGFL